MYDVTRILSRFESGDPAAAEKLLPLVDEELRKRAAAKLAQEKPGQTLQATALGQPFPPQADYQDREDAQASSRQSADLHATQDHQLHGGGGQRVTIMATKKTKKISWDESGERELTKFTDYICHCRDFAETIAEQKGHQAVTGEDVADAIQTYAALWTGLASKKKKTAPAAAKAKSVSPSAAPVLDEAIQKQIDELKQFIKEEQGESGDSGFGDPKARIAHWKREIEELKRGGATLHGYPQGSTMSVDAARRRINEGDRSSSAIDELFQATRRKQAG